MTPRDVGGMGEDEFRKWLKSVGLIPNKPEYDKGGWDFFVQWPVPQGTAENTLSLDQLPKPISCLIQVKSSDTGRTPEIKLSNWRHLCLDALPSFILLLNFGGGISPQTVHLIHMDEKWISKTLEKLRNLPASESGNLHKISMKLSPTDADQINPPYPEALRNKIEAIIGSDPAKYFEQKQRWIKDVGFDPNESRFSLTLTVSSEGDKNAEDKLVDLALGQIEDLSAIRSEIEEIRFGIPKPWSTSDPRDMAIKFIRFSGEKIKLSLRDQSGARYAQVEGEFLSPLAIFPFLKKESLRVRIKTKYADFILGPASRRFQFRSNSIDLDEEMALREIGNYADLVATLRDNSVPNLRIHVQFKEGRQFSLGIGHPNFGEPTPLDLEFEKAAADAWSIARSLNLDPETMVTARELHGFSQHLGTVRSLLDAQETTPSISLHGRAESDFSPDSLIGAALTTATFIGKTLIVVGAAVYGQPARTETPACDQSAFHIQSPIVKIVLREIIDNASEDNHPMAPYSERVVSWMLSQGIQPLPIEGDDWSAK
ncbi:hypothetical protein [Corallococcus exiguus]|uniref:hypothetical protein n=1 Tax=Corallococcus exiguus TaxID=83462 RepID=UPI0014721746|nr:hypothetical protein [Corallococcus exiguus]NNB88189.1 hypothetical protein [Corallococcus exiguus]